MAKKKVFSIGNALAEGLEETIASAQSYSGELRVEVIPIKRIEVDPENPRDLALHFNDVFSGISPTDPLRMRKIEELESLQSIAKSIKEQGIINPIIVFKFADKYRLIAGERRTLASILAGKIDIQAKILDQKPDELKVRLLQWIENIERSDLSLWERLRNLDKIVQAHAMKKGIPANQVSVTELSHLIGCTKPHAMNYKAVLNADDTLKQLIMDNQIKNLEKAALISDIRESDARELAINACISGATLKKLKVIADQSQIKPISLKPAERRGRQTRLVQFGFTKNLNVAQIILDSIMNNRSLTHLATHFKNVDRSDHRSVTEAFKQLLKKLEELHA